ncbi:3-deoxy-manno-octulosonate cytidylyltransferase (CMP-KDO synthetase)|uniref:3-deoxy-manno-octulosonate cytidylyltransferase (CMP-KDO synthetase) n=1 Tax=Brenneria salicis ATCC 15712 = DSM 30166 TaxID=714314 RepID=A0A366I191_9GAMM|nr:3-deoxy-manno-octulosonate cytidylyltransferase [Brenneria salicis]NMN92141.1 3-deoxy-manno-octulosonate cytidylyltransferase (CMP-KDO synthetase) [Brenneria salicis ATCC 15712 = DSM 30166]RBP61131.1 3-deoxy-manno-octulosonate cytidylyltransferase (CMP-KDO synthetase) [Brenneria salicis ATCC 15712 = DSM 30166]RLM28715.1 3-deoxy-manno-octulosonate cytidylyltransferase [Brenneria salicis ATCC 15712 = DSM 30166]
MNYAVVIPARYKSTRLPGKPLIALHGVPMIKRVWLRCCEAVAGEKIYIATDDKRIFDFCLTFTDNVIMTSGECKTGTDRVYEASEKIGDLDFVINVQGDEPIINPADIKAIIDECLRNPNVIVNGMAPIKDPLEYESKTIPKVAFRPDGRLMYMSRAAIPSNKTGAFNKSWKQICIYGFPIKALKDFSYCPDKTLFENEEDIEILRFLELGYDVNMVSVNGNSLAIDTPEDVEKVLKIISENSH